MRKHEVGRPMRGVGRVAVAVMAAVLLAGCGAVDDDGAAGKGAPAGKRDDLTSRQAVEKDIRAAVAAGDFGRAEYGEGFSEGRRAVCELSVTIRTADKPDRGPVDAAAAEMKARRWKREGEVWRDGSGQGSSFEKDGWTVSLIAGTASADSITAELPTARKTAEEGEVDDFSGVSFYGFRKGCGAVTPSPAP
ncbi:hypothetical protein [Streptomyces sp. NPDC058371]|uniref:hypothetical protein n=1 Tax=Streptomyces sp. NPDC058371 TaxID=3346463 RepID=UPI00364ABD09